MTQDQAYSGRPYPGRNKAQITPGDIPGGRIVPRDIEVEAAVLGALMLEKDAYSQVCEQLRPESFYEHRHELIYEAIQALGAEQRPIDILTVVNRLRESGTLDEAGGMEYIVGITSNVTSAAHIQFHANILSRKHLARQLITMAANIENMAFDESTDVEQMLQTAESDIFELAQHNIKKDVTQIDPVIDQAMEQINLAANRESGLSGLATGFHGLDKITAGWQPSDLIIIAARPAMGKTAFVLSMAKNMAVNMNTPVAFFSLEMSNLQLVNRLLSNSCEIEGSKIKTGDLTPIEWQRLQSRGSLLKGSPLYVDDTPSLSVLELRTKARRLLRERNIQLIIIDYLQLMNASGMKFGSREQEVSMISRSLKQLAKELNIPIIALSQLNRSVESRTNDNKRPQLSDLRESGAIEQDADIVCFIHRPEYYLRSGEDAAGNDIRGKAEFIIAKHRSGAVGDVDMRFRAPFARFENWSTFETDENNENDATPGFGYNRRASGMNSEPEPAAVAAEPISLPGQTPEQRPLARNDFPSTLAPDATEDKIPF